MLTLKNLKKLDTDAVLRTLGVQRKSIAKWLAPAIGALVGSSMLTLKNLKKLDTDDVLRTLGLQRRGSADWVMPVVGGLAAGMLVGVASGLLLAPTSGEKLRGELLRRLHDEEKELNPRLETA